MKIIKKDSVVVAHDTHAKRSYVRILEHNLEYKKLSGGVFAATQHVEKYDCAQEQSLIYNVLKDWGFTSPRTVIISLASGGLDIYCKLEDMHEI